MARRVSTEDIRQMNEVYCRCKSYAETARQTGWSASTVSKYVDKNYTPAAESDIKRFNISKMPEFSPIMFENITNFGELCTLSDEEKEEIKELWKELAI
jgi:hypothetical protein